MELVQISYIAEILATALVVVSLVYVGIQIKQNTATLKLNTAQNISENFTDIYLVLSQNSDMAEIFRKGLQDVDSLEAAEKIRFYAYFHKLFRIYENVYYQYQNKALEPEPFEGITNQLIMMSSMPGVKTYWNDRRLFYNSNFQTFVELSIMAPQDIDFEIVGT